MPVLVVLRSASHIHRNSQRQNKHAAPSGLDTTRLYSLRFLICSGYEKNVLIALACPCLALRRLVFSPLPKLFREMPYLHNCVATQREGETNRKIHFKFIFHPTRPYLPHHDSAGKKYECKLYLTSLGVWGSDKLSLLQNDFCIIFYPGQSRIAWGTQWVPGKWMSPYATTRTSSFQPLSQTYRMMPVVITSFK